MSLLCFEGTGKGRVQYRSDITILTDLGPETEGRDSGLRRVYNLDSEKTSRVFAITESGSEVPRR